MYNSSSANAVLVVIQADRVGWSFSLKEKTYLWEGIENSFFACLALELIQGSSASVKVN